MSLEQMKQKLITAYDRGMITKIFLMMKMYEVIGEADDPLLVQGLPDGLGQKMLNDCANLTDEDIAGTFIIEGVTTADPEAYSRNCAIRVEYIKHAQRLLRSAAKL